MPKIRRKSIENDFLLIFFYIQSKGAAQSSILMILRHPLSDYLHFSASSRSMIRLIKRLAISGRMRLFFATQPTSRSIPF